MSREAKYKQTLFGDRQTGRTAEALKACVHGSLYIVNTYREIPHTVNLCELLGRTDIKVISLIWVVEERWRGCEYAGVKFDHNCSIESECVKDLCDQLKACCGRNPPLNWDITETKPPKKRGRKPGAVGPNPNAQSNTRKLMEAMSVGDVIAVSVATDLEEHKVRQRAQERWVKASGKKFSCLTGLFIGQALVAEKTILITRNV